MLCADGSPSLAADDAPCYHLLIVCVFGFFPQNSSPAGLSPAARFALGELEPAEGGRGAFPFGGGSSSANGSSQVPSLSSVAHCSICLSSPADAMCLPCGHSHFCFACLARWTASNRHCPVCRHDIRDVVRMTPENVRRRDQTEAAVALAQQ